MGQHGGGDEAGEAGTLDLVLTGVARRRSGFHSRPGEGDVVGQLNGCCMRNDKGPFALGARMLSKHSLRRSAGGAAVRYRGDASSSLWCPIRGLLRTWCGYWRRRLLVKAGRIRECPVARDGAASGWLQLFRIGATTTLVALRVHRILRLARERFHAFIPRKGSSR